MTVALATEEDVLALTGGTAPDGLDRLIQMASATVERFCRRSFRYAADEEITVRVTDGTMRLPNDPIIEVSELLDPDGTEVAADSFEAFEDGWVRRGLTQRDPDGPALRWPSGLYTVTFTHGYLEIPDDVVGVVADVVARHLAVGAGRVSVSLGQFTESYRPDAGAGLFLTSENRRALAGYRRSPSAVRAVR